MNKKIAIIGMGHMGKALMKGLEQSGFEKEHIFVSDNSEENKKVAAQADWIIVAVKPTIVSQVIEDIKGVVTDKLVISVAAAVSIDSFQNYLGNNNQKIVRLMPNLPIAYGQGVIGLYANASVSNSEKDEVMQLVSGLGTVVDCQQEEELEMITILAGSGPAVVAYCLSLFENAGESFGLDHKKAKQIAYQTFIGTLELLKQTGQTAKELQDAVATKGGITEQIISSLEEEKTASIFQKSFEKGYARIKEIKKS